MRKLYEVMSCMKTCQYSPVVFNDNIVQVDLHLQLEYHEKGQYFLSLISESETHILYRLITHRVKYFKPLFPEICMFMAYI